MRTLLGLLLLSSHCDCFLVAPRAPPSHAKQLQAQRPRAAITASLRDDVRVVGAATLAGLVLMASPMPAHAKGGGHGGGGHSSSHSSSSSRRTLHSSPSRRSRSSRSRSSSSGYSSRSYSSRSYSAASPPPPMLLYPDESAARRGDGFYCPRLPRVGERVDVAGEPGQPGTRRTGTVLSSQPPSQKALYDADGGVLLQPVPGFESDCSVTVKFDDGTTGTVSAAEEPTPRFVQGLQTAAVLGYGGFIVSDAFGDASDGWARTEERHEELLEELSLAGRSGEDAPLSGEYWGSSEESDEGDQAVRSTINFRADGTITGRGRDGVDGSYRISRGRWGVRDGERRPQVAWIETYDEGFEVAVQGTYEPRDGKIKARFTSSRGVGGAFALAPKPSVF